MSSVPISGPGTGNDVVPVFAAKLRQPDPGPCLRRDRLFQCLDASAGMPLVVIHADAGYGKTTLVASYLRERARGAIWYHVGVTDRLRGTVVAHLLQAVAEDFPTDPDPIPVPDDPELADAALAALLARVGTPVTLVFDEYDRADDDNELHRMVQAMVEHLPPSAQLLLLSRSRPPLPLQRLSLTRKVQELTKVDLAFSLEETAALYSRTYGLYLTAEELALVALRLEGWAVGLQLTHLALKGTALSERARFWARFADSPALFDYLAEEAFSALSADTLDFLQRTAVFSILQPELIEELLPGCGAAATLRRLARDNLFTTALNAAGTHYRYHPVFRRYLHRRLVETAGPEAVRHLHARAAAMYAHREQFDFAIGHTLAARDYRRFVLFVDRLTQRHRGDVLLRLMEGWLERAFPDTEDVAGVVFRRLLPLSAYESVLPDLFRIAEGSGDSADPLGRAYAQQRLGAYFCYRGRPTDGLVWLSLSRDTFRSASYWMPAAISGTLLGMCYLFLGRIAEADLVVADALAWAGDSPTCVSMNVHLIRAEVCLAQGRFREAEEAARVALDLDAPLMALSAFAHSAVASALLAQGRAAEARVAAHAALAEARRTGMRTDLGHSLVRLAMALRALGNLKGARAAAAKAVRALDGFGIFLARAMLIRADLAAETGEPQAERLWEETRVFWKTNGYPFVPEYDGLVAPFLLRKVAVQTGGGTGSGVPGEAKAGDTASAGTISIVIRTLGTFRLSILDRDSHPGRWGRAPARRLFFYLLVHRGRLVNRDEIIDALWPGEAPAACGPRLASAVSALRRELSPLGHILERQGPMYCLRLPADTDLDMDRYVVLAENGLVRGDPDALRGAAFLYQGDFLVEYPYDEFLETERRRLKELHVRVVMALGNSAWKARDLDLAMNSYREAQRLDPLLEEPVRRIMEILITRSEPGAAVAAFGLLRNALRGDLGLDPSEEIDVLYRRALNHARARRQRA